MSEDRVDDGAEGRVDDGAEGRADDRVSGYPAEELERAVEVISSASSLALACHVMPDGDALGSMLALHLLARAAGKPSVASWPEPFVVAPHYRFLPGLDLATPPSQFPDEPDVMVTFDCASLERLVELAPVAGRARQLVVIDHHATNTLYGKVNLVDSRAAASAVVVRRLAQALGWSLDRDVAMCLYTGLVCDTGRFQYENTTPEVFSLATELTGFDLPIASMTRQLFEEHRFAYLRLVAALLERAQLDPARRFVATWVTSEDLRRFDVELEETEGMIDVLRRTSEADVSCVLKETADGTRVSLRAVADVDVAAIARRFGGGGHRAAAGFTSSRPVSEVLAEIRDALPDTRPGGPAEQPLPVGGTEG